MNDQPAATIGPQFSQSGGAALYRDIQLPLIFTPWSRVLFEVVPVCPGDAVLDVATGPGTVARPAAALAGPSGRVIGVDVSAAMLATGRSWPTEPGSAPIEYVESSADAISLPDTSVDVAYCQHGLHWMSDPEATLRNVHRILKFGGRLGVAIWTRSPFDSYRTTLVELGISEETPRPSAFGRDAGELAAALVRAGFHDVQVQERELVTPIADMGTAVQAVGSLGLAAILAKRSEAEQHEIREAIARSLTHLVKGGAVHVASAANLASARK